MEGRQTAVEGRQTAVEGRPLAEGRTAAEAEPEAQQDRQEGLEL